MGHDSGLGLEDRMSWMTVGTVSSTLLSELELLLIHPRLLDLVTF